MIISNYTGDAFEKSAYSNCNRTIEVRISYAQASRRLLLLLVEYLRAFQRLVVIGRFFGFISLPLSVVEFAITVLFFATLWQAIVLRRVSRKCYLLILNRSIGDLVLSSACLAISGYVIIADFSTKELQQWTRQLKMYEQLKLFCRKQCLLEKFSRSKTVGAISYRSHYFKR